MNRKNLTPAIDKCTGKYVVCIVANNTYHTRFSFKAVELNFHPSAGQTHQCFTYKHLVESGNTILPRFNTTY